MAVAKKPKIAYTNNVYCFECRAPMVEVIAEKAYWCQHRVVSTDPIVGAQIEAGWSPCLVCIGNTVRGCPDCDFLGVILPKKEEE